MSYAKKRINLFIMAILFFIPVLFGFSLYAADNVIYLNQASVDRLKANCTETNCYFPGKFLDDKDIRVTDSVNWKDDKNSIISCKSLTSLTSI